LKWMLDNGKSFNLYMFHGGTNFGFWAGANYIDGRFEADVTSYDYGSPLNEAGVPTPEYKWMRKMFADYQQDGAALPDLPAPIPTIVIPELRFTRSAPLFKNLPAPKPSIQPMPMELYGQYYGYILYRTKLPVKKSGKLIIHDLHDYAYIYLDGKLIGELDRQKGENSISIPQSDGTARTLDILVEALGRINFGPMMIDRKGITNFVEMSDMTLMHWDVFNLPMDDKQLAGLKFGNSPAAGMPGFYKAEFDLSETGDTFLDMSKWNKGAVWVNGRNLGRYWNIGPQKHLYLPGCWLKKGKNEIIVFEMKTPDDRSITSHGKWPYKFQPTYF